jgi:HK97 family phage portal protein
MGVVTRLLRPIEKRQVLGEGATAWMLDAFGGVVSSGVAVSPEGSLRYSTVLACVRVLAEGVASLPCLLYERREENGREAKRRAREHPLYGLLHDAPNGVQTALEFFEVGMAHLALWGNFYAEIEWGPRGEVQALWPLAPWRVTPHWSREGKAYKLELDSAPAKTFADYQVLHIPGFGYDGVAGKSLISLAKETVGLGMAAERYGATVFGNGAVPGGVLRHPGELSDKAYDRLVASWAERHQGLSNAQRLAILEEGMEYVKIGIPPEDAQFLETRKFQRSEIAAIFRVPPHMIGDLERATFSNIEHQSVEFLTNSLAPWLRRWEQRILRSLLIGAERQRFYAEFLVDALLRGDTQTRYAAYAIGRQWGWLSVNDIRQRENMNPVDGGEEYLVPMNMAPAGEELDAPDAPDTPDEDQDVRARTLDGLGRCRSDGLAGTEARAAEERAAHDRRTVDGRRRLARTYRPTLRHMAQRIVNREVNDLRQAARRYLPDDVARFRMWLADFDAKHTAFVGEYMDAPVRAYLALVGEQVEREVDQPVTPEMLEQFGTDYVAGRRNRWMANLIRGVEGVLAGGQRSQDGQETREEPDVLAEMETWLDERADSEADDYAEDESNTGSNAAAVALYLLLGIQVKRWMAFGESCEYCQALDGRTVATAQWFLDPDNPLSVASGQVWVPSGNVGHAPLHRGCDCMVVAG